MMKNSRLEKDKKIEEKLIKDVRNLFGLKEYIDDTTVKDIRNLYRLRKWNEAIKHRIIRDISNLSEHEEKDYYKPVRVGNFRSNNYTEYESHGDRLITLSVEEYPNKIRLYLKDIRNDLKESNMWKVQLMIAINFMSSKDNDEEYVVHSKSDNMEMMIIDKTDEVTEEPFQLVLSRYQVGLKKSKGSSFIFKRGYHI